MRIYLTAARQKIAEGNWQEWRRSTCWDPSTHWRGTCHSTAFKVNTLNTDRRIPAVQLLQSVCLIGD